MATRVLPMPGMRLGRYELLEQLAVGGMAEIFLARAVGIEGFEKLVVCKCILSQRASDDDFVKMFVDEARLAAQLHHPNVAHVFDIGREGDLHFFAMEYVHGADVHEIQAAARAKGGVPLEQALAITIGAAAGLHYAHEKADSSGQPLGIVHRDVSPSNVLVSFDGGVKVVDFGIAKATSQWARTRTGSIKGKVACMSPEQCRGEALDRRSDVFAVGILLYELTTGVRPFQAESDYAIIRRIVDEDAAPPSTHRPDYPPKLEAIVMRALRRNLAERYATAQELQIDLETFAREEDLVVSSVELGRYMQELFGDRRPPRATLAPETFLHPRPGDGAPARAATAATPTSPIAIVHRRRTRAAAVAGLAAALVAGVFVLGSRFRSSAEVRPAAPHDTVLTTAAPTPAPVTASDTPVPATVVDVNAPSGSPGLGAAQRRSPQLHSQPHSQPPELAAPKKRRAPPKRTPTTRTSVRERDLDAPFPR